VSQPTSIKNNGGFTLIEVMVAILIMAIGMLGVLESINVSLQHNLKNELRNEAIRIGERYMAEFRGSNFDSLTDTYADVDVQTKSRAANKTYTVERSTEQLSADARRVTVVVKWSFRNQDYQNRLVSVVARP